MGFPLLTYQDRSDNKLYRLQTPQSPLVRPYMYDYYDMDNYPIGTNAIVAVISYTGYDMEDAMVSFTGRYRHFNFYLLKKKKLRSCRENLYAPNAVFGTTVKWLIPGFS